MVALHNTSLTNESCSMFQIQTTKIIKAWILVKNHVERFGKSLSVQSPTKPAS